MSSAGLWASSKMKSRKMPSCALSHSSSVVASCSSGPELASGDCYFPRYSRSQLTPPRGPAAGLPKGEGKHLQLAGNVTPPRRRAAGLPWERRNSVRRRLFGFHPADERRGIIRRRKAAVNEPTTELSPRSSRGASFQAPELVSGVRYFPRYSRSQLTPPRRRAARLP